MVRYAELRFGTVLSISSPAAGKYYFDLALPPSDGGGYQLVVYTYQIRATYFPAAPVITAQPASATIPIGGAVTFGVTATGANLTYQWYQNNTAIGGANSATYTIYYVVATDAGSYDVTVANSGGQVTSSKATLTIATAPTITVQPQNVTTIDGQSATLQVTASGTAPLTYQWQKDGGNLVNDGNITGATTATLTVTSTSATDAGSYDVVVANGYGSATSSPATLTVDFLPSVTNQPSGQTVRVGSGASFSVGATGTAPLTYQWQENGSGLSNGGNITGATTAMLTITNISYSDAASYSVVVSNAEGGVLSSNATLTVIGPPSMAVELTNWLNMPGSDVEQIVTNLIIPNTVGAVAVNPAPNKIYVAGGWSPQQMLKIDGDTFNQVGVGSGSAVDVDITNNNYWSPEGYNASVTAWNSNDTSVANISLGYCPGWVNVDAPHRVVWVEAQCGSGNDPVWAINADTYGIIAGPIGSGGVQGSSVVNPATGRLYIDPSNVSKRVNPSTFAVTANAFGVVMAANASANLLYATTNSSPFTTLQLINGAPDPEVVLTNITLPFAFRNLIGVNPVLNRIYIGYNTTNIIAILSATTGQSIGSVSLGAGITSVGNITVDASRNRNYALAYGGGSTYLFVIQDTPFQSINMYPILTILGSIGSTNQIEYVSNLNNTNWIALTNVVLSANPYVFIDYSSAGHSQRFYRAVQH